MKHEKHTKSGYLTVYLSLSLTLLLSLLLTLVEGARINTIRMESECAADIGMNSVLAEFHRELLEQYDLLFVDSSYGTASPSVEKSAQHLRNYMQKNFTVGERGPDNVRDWLALYVDKAVLSEYSIASDKNGDVMKGQALAYMKESTAEGVITKITGHISENIPSFESLGLDTRDIDGERNNFQAQIDAIELPKEMNENNEEIEIPLNNPADKVNALRAGSILSLVLKDTSLLSGSVIHTEDYISHRVLYGGIGPSPESTANGAVDNILFDEYLIEKCSRYGKELDKSLLKYQIEYILEGRSSDKENLEKVAKRLLAWREVSNLIYILSDSEKCAQARALALSLTAVLQVPALTEPVKYSILFAWAYIESLYDVRCLLNGGKIPMLKTGADWKTDIDSVANFSGDIPDEDNGKRGLSYVDYLRIMLFLEKDDTKKLRTMDVMEMDIRITPGNIYFRMDACFDSFLADISVSSGFGYHFDIRKRYGYD
jgi:hypothetical protein